ncbi:MAG: FkbM family methyltransferase [Planctomycetota bacterium]
MSTLDAPPSVADSTAQAAPPHPAFAGFERWSGPGDPAMFFDWLGVRTRRDFFSLFQASTASPGPSVLRPAYPPIDEEFFEWVDVLESVRCAAQSGQERFVMIELGAGWGRWLMRAAAAMRALRPAFPVELVAVEAEPEHFGFLLDHLRDNGINPANHDLRQAAVATESGHTPFFVGAGRRWYGQAIAGPDVGPVDAFPEAAIEQVPAVTLTELLEPRARVDLIDLDVQGVEADVLQSAAELLDERVARAHIGTHGAAIERDCRSLFFDLGWSCVRDYPCGGQNIDTPQGPVDFGDGVQSWVNPRLVEQGGAA